jgi:thiosulfate dehydrogenase (quinone) large subunit
MAVDMERMSITAEPVVVSHNGTAPTTTPRRREIGVGAGVTLGVLRMFMGFTFLWAFLDKAFALGFSTGRNVDTGAINFFGPDAWIKGGSPTDGVLLFALKGPFKGLYDGLAGQTWVEWVYMLSMLLIGTALILGVATRLAAIGGIIWLTIFYTATAIWPEHNPFLDEHVVYAVLLFALVLLGAGSYLGLGDRWNRTKLVRRLPFLK